MHTTLLPRLWATSPRRGTRELRQFILVHSRSLSSALVRIRRVASGATAPGEARALAAERARRRALGGEAVVVNRLERGAAVVHVGAVERRQPKKPCFSARQVERMRTCARARTQSLSLFVLCFARRRSESATAAARFGDSSARAPVLVHATASRSRRRRPARSWQSARTRARCAAARRAR